MPEDEGAAYLQQGCFRWCFKICNVSDDGRHTARNTIGELETPG